MTAGPPPAWSTRWIATGGTVNVVPGPEHPRARGRTERQAILAHAPGDDRDRGGGLIVVVKAGVLVVAPADHPRIDLVVVPDPRIGARASGVADQVAPALRGGREAGREAT